jgi:hypothetical protein
MEIHAILRPHLTAAPYPANLWEATKREPSSYLRRCALTKNGRAATTRPNVLELALMKDFPPGRSTTPRETWCWKSARDKAADYPTLSESPYFERSLNSSRAGLHRYRSRAKRCLTRLRRNKCRKRKELELSQATIPHALDITTNFVHGQDSLFWANDEQTAVIGRGRRNQGWSPENLLIKWRSHAGCGFDLSTCQPCVCSYTYVRHRPPAHVYG